MATDSPGSPMAPSVRTGAPRVPHDVPLQAPARPRFLDEVRARLRMKPCSRRTEESYIGWIRRFILFNGKCHPAELGEGELTRFLSSLAVDRNVASCAQNQALSALLFLCSEVLKRDLPWLQGIVRARGPRRLPTVLSREEVAAVLGRITRPGSCHTLRHSSATHLLQGVAFLPGHPPGRETAAGGVSA